MSLAREWDLEGGPPRVGQHLPVMDHTGTRRGTVEIVSVTSAPFGEIDGDAVWAESAGACTPGEWHELQRAFYQSCRGEIALLLGEPGWGCAMTS